MMALILLALPLVVRATETGSKTWLFGAAATLGVAFDVKLLDRLSSPPA